MNIGHETPKTIRAWAVDVFGGTGTTLSRLLRTHREMTELLDELMLGMTRIRKIEHRFPTDFNLHHLGQEDRDRIVGEVADVAILLMDTAEAVNVTVTLPIAGTGSASALDRAVNANICLSKLIDNARRMYFGIGDQEAWLTGHQVRSALFPLAFIAQECGTTLQGAVDLKMKINRLRQWHVDENHNGTHVKGASPGIRFGVHEANAWAEKIAAEEARKAANHADFIVRAIGPLTPEVLKHTGPLTPEIAAAYLRTTSPCVCGTGAN